MKRTVLLVVFSLAFGLSARAQTSLTFTFDNLQTTSAGYEFDVMVAAGQSGTRLGDTQVYVNYNTAAFGQNVKNNGRITVAKGTLLEGDTPYGAKYAQVINDNDISRVSIVHTYGFDGAPEQGNAVPTTPTQLFHVTLDIVDGAEPSELSFDESLMDGQQFYSDNSTQYDPVVASDAQASIEVGQTAGWRMMAPPLGGITVGDLARQNLVQGIDGVYGGKYDAATVNLYTGYNVDASGNGEGCSDANSDSRYVCPSDSTATLQSGKGFVWYLYDEAKVEETTPVSEFTWEPTGSVPSNDVDVTLVDGNQNFYLLGNPYNSAYDLSGLNLDKNGDGSDDDGTPDFSNVVQVWNPNGGNYETITRGDPNDQVATGQGFFVERNSGDTDRSEQLTFSAGSAGGSTTFYGKRSSSSEQTAAEPRRLQLRVTGRGADSTARSGGTATLYFAEGATPHWRDAYTASALAPFSTPYATLAFDDQSGDLLAQASLPRDLTETATLPVRLSTYGEAGTHFTLSWPQIENIPDGWTLTLKDTETGKTIDLRGDGQYTFERAAPSAGKAAGKAERASNAAPRLPKALRLKAPAGKHAAGPRFRLTVTPSGAVATEKPGRAGPKTLTFAGVAPNPARASTTFRYALPETRSVTVSVFDALGRRVATPVAGERQEAGRQQVYFNAGRLPAGVYFVRVRAGAKQVTGKLVVAR